MRYFVTLPSGREIPVDVTIEPTGQTRVSVEGRSLEVDAIDHRGTVSLRVDGRVLDLWLEGTPPDVGIVVGEQRFYAKVESEQARALAAAMGDKAGGAGEGLVRSPMPGRVLKVLVHEGDEVTSGMPLVVVEAMKMENELTAGKSGRVRKVHVAPGATVDGGAKLIEIE
jgi:biotin carboxyl carrier protein